MRERERTNFECRVCDYASDEYGDTHWHPELHMPPTESVEGVGTGAGEGATGQDTGTAWVTRSEDCPEAPAQAHPLGSARCGATPDEQGDCQFTAADECACRNAGLSNPPGVNNGE